MDRRADRVHAARRRAARRSPVASEGRAGGRTWDVESEIVELVPGRRLAARATSSAFASTLSYSLEPAPEGTRVHGTVETRLRGVAGRLLGGVAGRAAERKLVADLGRLKRLLEP
jgi:hypothetical protein